MLHALKTIFTEVGMGESNILVNQRNDDRRGTLTGALRAAQWPIFQLVSCSYWPV